MDLLESGVVILYDPFGSLLPGRNYSSSTYRHAFNGMEKDDEIHGATGTSYDFGARLFDSRVGKWWSIDPKASKYPGESPFAFAGNNPLSMIDDGGEEKVVVVGSDHKDNTWKFVNAALGQLRKYRNSADETRTMLLLNADTYYTPQEVKRLKFIGRFLGFRVVEVSTANEIADYIGGGSVNAHGYSRQEDPVTSLDIFSHGNTEGIHLNYPAAGATTIDEGFVQAVKPDAFAPGAVVSSFACRTGASIDIPKGSTSARTADYSIEGQMEVNGTQESLAQRMADAWGLDVKAFTSRTEYGEIYGNVLERNLMLESRYGAEKVGDKKGDLYHGGAPYDVKGAGSTPKVNSNQHVFRRGEKPTPIAR